MEEKRRIELALLCHFKTYCLTEEQTRSLIDATVHFLIVRNAIGASAHTPESYLKDAVQKIECNL